MGDGKSGEGSGGNEEKVDTFFNQYTEDVLRNFVTSSGELDYDPAKLMTVAIYWLREIYLEINEIKVDYLRNFSFTEHGSVYSYNTND